MSRYRGAPVRAQVSVCYDLAEGGDRVVDAGSAFFRLGWEMLGGPLRDRVDQIAAEGGYLGSDLQLAVEGGVCAEGFVDTEDTLGRIRKRSFRYSQRMPDKVAAALDSCTVRAAVDADSWGYYPGTSDRLRLVEPSLNIGWERSTKEPEPLPDWVQLCLGSSWEHLLGTRERQIATMEFLCRIVEHTNPACGEISYEPAEYFSAPLEYLLSRQRRRKDSVSESRRVVRSYSWVTVVSEEIGQRLGGLEGLRASGAFWRVEHLAGGGFLLQATERFEQYRYEQAYEVFRVLAPALPPGVPEAPAVWPENYHLADDPEFMIVREDPSSVVT